MKKTTTKAILTAAALLSVNFFTYAGVWRVNSTPGINADFTTIQAAHNGAIPGDTIYVEGSKNSYGDLTLSKPLTFIGPGYFLAENPQTQASSTPAFAGAVLIQPGAQGSVFTGLTFNGSIKIKSSKITLKRNNATGGIIINDSSAASYGITDIVINQNYISTLADGVGNMGATNVIICNNIITGTLTLNLSGGINIYNNYTGGAMVIKSGVFRNNYAGYGSPSSFTNTTVQNNVFYASSYTQNTVSTVDTSNKFGIAFATIFVNAGSPDGKYQVKLGGPGQNYGADGSNIGPFGGPTPYIPSGIPSVPTIYDLLAAPSGNSTNGLNVNIKAKSRP